MSVIGNPLVTTNYISDSFSGDASTVAFTLSQAPASAASIAVYISGLYQIPTSAYTISGTTLTFTGAPPTGTNNITVLHLGVKSATLVPVAGSVTPQMLNNANVIYWSTSNNNIGIGNTTPTSLLTVTGTAALGNTTITGSANVTSTIQGGAGLTIAGAASGITTLAAGNTTITGTANVSSDVYVGGYFSVNSTPTTGYRVTIDNGGATTGDYSPLVLKGGSSSENGGQLGFWNTYAGVSNPKKWIRVDNSGKLGIINSGYTAQIFSLDDSGNLTVAGTFGSSSRGITKGSMPAGCVLQVVSATKTDTFTTSGTGFADVPGLSVSITPSSSSSKILISYSVSGAGTVSGSFIAIRLVRNTTSIALADSYASAASVTSTVGYTQDSGGELNQSMSYLDSPATTSATTYKLTASSLHNGQNCYINRSQADDSSYTRARSVSSITVMEIAA